MTDENIERLAKEEWESDPELRIEFENNFREYLAWREADYRGQIKILNH